MKALSFSQPWLWAVLYAGKLIENRSWAPPIEMIGQRIALHAAKSWDKKQIYPRYGTERQDLLTPTGYLLALGLEPPSRIETYAKSAIVGVATIDYVRTSAEGFPPELRRWFFGPFGWALRDVQVLPVTVPATGKLGLWTVADEDEAAVRAQIVEAA